MSLTFATEMEAEMERNNKRPHKHDKMSTFVCLVFV